MVKISKCSDKKLHKVRFLLAAAVLVLSFCFTGCDSDDEAYNEGYKKGLVEGKSAAVSDCESNLKKLEAENRQKLEVKRQEYEKQVKDAYDAAYAEGQKSMQYDLNQTITVKDSTTVKSKKKTNKK